MFQGLSIILAHTRMARREALESGVKAGDEQGHRGEGGKYRREGGGGILFFVWEDE